MVKKVVWWKYAAFNLSCIATGVVLLLSVHFAVAAFFNTNAAAPRPDLNIVRLTCEQQKLYDFVPVVDENGNQVYELDGSPQILPLNPRSRIVGTLVIRNDGAPVSGRVLLRVNADPAKSETLVSYPATIGSGQTETISVNVTTRGDRPWSCVPVFISSDGQTYSINNFRRRTLP